MALKSILECRAVSTAASITLSFTPNSSDFDDVTGWNSGVDWVLVTKNGTGNGVYLINTGGAWTRVTNATASADFLGMTVLVRGEGTKFGHSLWQCTNNTFLLGTDTAVFRRIGGDRRDDWRHADLESPQELTDGDQTVNVSSASTNGHFTAPQGLFTASRTVTLGTTNAVAGSALAITRAGSSSNLLVIKDLGGTELHRIAVPGTVRFVFDGSNWVRDRHQDVTGDVALDVRHFGGQAGAGSSAAVATSAAFQAAHDALPSTGGTLVADGDLPYTTRATLAFTKPVRLRLGRGGIASDGDASATTLITTSSSLVIEGHDPYETVLTPKAGQSAIKILDRGSVSSGRDVFFMRRVRIQGGSRGLDTEGLDNFSEGKIHVHECSFHEQTDVAIYIEENVSYVHLSYCFAYEVEQAVFCKKATELKMICCEWEQTRTATKDLVVNAGTSHFLAFGCTFFLRRPNDKAALRIYPSADGLNGESWVQFNKFGTEGMEDFRDAPPLVIGDGSNPTRTQRVVHASNNLFGGPAFLTITTIARVNGTSTVTATVQCNANASTHGLQVGDRVLVAFIADVSFDGTWTVTAIGSPPGVGGTQTVSWTQAGATVTVGSNPGVIHNAGLSAIKHLSPVGHAHYTRNDFYNYSFGIDESATSNHTVLGESGQNVAVDNHGHAPNGSRFQLFKRGGVGFSKAEELPGAGSRRWFGQKPRLAETLSLINRIAYSEDFSQWAPGSGDITVLPNVPTNADPWGTSRASKLSRAGGSDMLSGTYPFQTIAAGIQRGIDDSVGSPIHGVLSFWAKRYDADNDVLSVFIKNEDGDFVLPVTTVHLESYWDRYTIPFCRLATGTTNVLVICPGNNSAAAAQAYLVGVQVADEDSDYILTSGSAANDATAGSRTELRQIHAALTASRLVASDSSKKLVSHAPGNTKVVATDGSGDLLAIGYGSAATANEIVRRDASGGAAFDDLTAARLGVGQSPHATIPVSVLGPSTSFSIDLTAPASDWWGIGFHGGVYGAVRIPLGTNDGIQWEAYNNHRFMIGTSATYGSRTEVARIDANGIGVGVTAPTARLHLKEVTASANTAPLKITSGSNLLSTAETGAFEYKSPDLYFTPTGTTREKIYTGPVVVGISGPASLTANSEWESSATSLTAAAVGNLCVVGPPSAPPSGVLWGAYVSSAGNVKLRIRNFTGSTVDASGTWNVTIQH